MVSIHPLVAIGIMLVSIAVQADGIEPEMRDPRLPTIKSVDIKEVAARSPAAGESDEQCGRFVLSLAEVRRYGRAE